MKIITLFITFLLLSTTMLYADEYYIGQWNWCIDQEISEGEEDFGEVIIDEYWCAPSKRFLTGVIDLRSLPQQAKSGGVPEGYAIFPYSQKVNHPLLTYLGGDSRDILTVKRMNQIRNKLGISLRIGTIRQVIKQIGIEEADPTGQTRWKPFMPRKKDGKRGFKLGTDIDEEIDKVSFKMFESDGWELVMATEQADYSRLAKTETEETMAMVLDLLEEKYQVFYGYFIPEHETFIASLPHNTTYTEDWDGTDQSNVSCNMNEDLNWTCTEGKFWQQSNKIYTNDSGSDEFARADHDLSGSDMYSEVDSVFSKHSSGGMGVAIRYDSSANTHYYCTQIRVSTNTFRVGKNVAGTKTDLSTANQSGITYGTIRCEIDGDDIEMFFDTVSRITLTDTAITGNIRGGVVHYPASRDVRLDNFETGDLSSPAATSRIKVMIF